MITNNDIKWFNFAKELSFLSDFKKARLGCAAVYKNRLISIGYNQMKSHSIQKIYDIYRFDSDTPHRLHSEIACLVKIKNNRNYDNIDFRKIKLYIYRERRDESIAQSHPCKSCEMFIRELGIRDIYFTSDSGYCYERLIY